MKKRIIVILMCLTLVLSLAACSKSKDISDDEDVKTSSEKKKDKDKDKDKDSDGGSFKLGDLFAKDNTGVVAEPAPGQPGSDYTDPDFTDPDFTDPDAYAGSDIGSGPAGLFSGSMFTADQKNINITAYKVGTDKLHFVFEGELCNGLKPVNEYDEGRDQFTLVIGSDWNYQCTFSTFYANFGYSDGGEWKNFDNGGWRQNVCAFDNLYTCTLIGEGICDILPESSEYSLYCVPRNNSEGMDQYLVKTGKFSDLLQTTSEEELASMLLAEKLMYTPGNKAHEIWEGTYLSDTYSDVNAYVYIDVTDTGLLFVQYFGDDMTREFILEESSYDEAVYDYGSYISASAALSAEGGDNEYLDMSIYCDSDGNPSLSMRYSNYNTSMYSYVNLYKYNQRHQATEGYEDIDEYGKMQEAFDDTSIYYMPESDDYLIEYYNTSKYNIYNESDWSVEKSYPYETWNMYCFDANGIEKSRHLRYKFESADDAREVYDYMINKSSYSSDEVHCVDNLIYYVSTGISDDKLHRLYSCNWFYDCNYAKYNYMNDGQIFYIWMSKPITEEERHAITLEEALFWRKIGNGEHYSRDEAGYYLYAWVYDDDCSISCSASDFEYAYSSSSMRFNGASAISVGYSEWEERVIVTEYEFDKTDAVVTQYVYDWYDFSNIEITFDNYKSYTPVKTVTHTYDMTRLVSSY